MDDEAKRQIPTMTKSHHGGNLSYGDGDIDTNEEEGNGF